MGSLMRLPRKSNSSQSLLLVFTLTLLLSLLGSGCPNSSPADQTASSPSPESTIKASQVEESPVVAQTQVGEENFKVVTVAEGLSNPWSLAFLPDRSILITERSGTLRKFVDGKLLEKPIGGVPEVFSRGQGGLLDIALHPKFAENRWVYLSYSKPGPEGATTAVCRGKLGNESLQEVEEIFVASAWSKTTRHFGSRLLFDDQGYLFVTVGERGDMKRAQDPGDHAGTTLRLNDDGSVPKDNPFVGKAGFLPEIYSYGHRNAQGMVLHPETREVWQNEHGPRGGDELNIIKAGANYGWPKVTYGIDYNGSEISAQTEMPGMEAPLLHWTPSIAASGMEVYTGDVFPEWKGNVFVGALILAHLQRITLKDGKPVHREQLLGGLKERIRYVRQGPDGFLYILTDTSRGRLLRLEPK